MKRRFTTFPAVGAICLLLAAGCYPVFTGPEAAETLDQRCSIDESAIRDGGVGRDGIPALTGPRTAGVGSESTEYLRPDDRVVGVVIGGNAVAVPLNILWWHEVVNLRLDGRDIAVTHCPLTGSSLVFDRGGVDGREFIVSGLLFRTNLVMTFRDAGVNPEGELSASSSLFPQMSGGARCGRLKGLDLEMVPALEMMWSGWRELYPDTEMVTSRTGYDRDYRRYPYGSYDDPYNASTGVPVSEMDLRRPPKERVLGIPEGNGGLARTSVCRRQ